MGLPAPFHPPPTRMKARIVVPLVLLLGVALYYLGPWRPKQAAIRYREVEITRGDLESRVSATGTLNPVDQVEIGSQVSGTIQRRFVDYNSRVRAGQVLAQIDPVLFRANLSQAEANVEKAKVSVADAERALGRAKDLKQQGLISQSDLDTAQTALDSHRADLKQAQASLELAQANLANTTITSPISGIVISRSIDVGQTVAASLQAPKLFVIARDLSEMELEASVDEADIGQVREGQPVSFTVDSYPDRMFEGNVLQVRAEPIAESGVVSYITVVRVPNTEGRLLPGMTANVTIVTAARENVLRVPNAALRFRPKVEQRSGGERRVGAGESGGGAASASPPRSPEARGSGKGSAQGGGFKKEGGRTSAGGARMSTVYMIPPGSKSPEAVPIRAGITDGTLTEIVEGPLQEGSKVVVGEIDSSVKRTTTPNPLGGAPAGAGGGGRGGRGGR